MFEKNKDKKTEKKKESFSESISGIAAVFVCGLFIITFIVQAFEIPSGSMENTLLVGDHVFVDRITPMPKGGLLGAIMPYRQIKRGDIIVFLHPRDPGMFVVKRVMGIPGDRIHLQDGVVYRNGQPLNEPYIFREGTDSEYRENFPKGTPSDEYPDWPIEMSQHLQNGDLVVPPNSYFGMGDHRDVSLDSRYWGFIPRDNIVGRPLFIYWSFVTPSNQYERRDMPDRVRFVVHTIVHFFDQTRWGRMFHVVR
ncbi:MAG TPA: signal peptidase I [Candidatus Angelobacter sp.]|nr:signal peptidase I [Candidatus Angelobacter sp.]